MSVNLSYLGGAGWQFFDNNGIPLNGGLIYTYLAGTTTPLTTFTDNTGLIANTNPIILDAAGRVPHQIWIQNNTPAKFDIRTSTNVTIRVEDNISYNAFQEFLNVKDFGAVGDGTTNDTTAITNAVAAAFTQSAILIFPSGSYLTTTSIPNLHNVRKIGSGAVKRGANLFYVQIDDTHTNTIFLDPAGNLTNDGLSSLFPISTIQQGFNVLFKYGPSLNGSWILQSTSGSFTTPATLVDLGSSNPITLTGPVVGHPNVPTAILDGTGSSDTGLLTANVNLIVSNFLMKNWTSISPNKGAGFILTGNSRISFQNVHAYGCSAYGALLTNGSILSVNGGIIDGVTPGFTKQGIQISNNSAADLGDVLASPGADLIIKRCDKGVLVSNCGSVEIDNCNINNNTTGLLTVSSSSSSVAGTSLVSNAVALRTESSSSLMLGLGNTFTTNTKDFINFSSSDDVSNLDIYFDRPTKNWLYGGNGSTTLLPNAPATAKFQWQCDPTPTATPTYTNPNVKAIIDLGDSSTFPARLALVVGSVTPIAGLTFNTTSSLVAGAIDYIFALGSFSFSVGSPVSTYLLGPTAFLPSADGVPNLGGPSNRWNTVYATTGTINTSDAREKQQVRDLSESEKRVALKCKSLIKAFKFNSAVNEKNDKARIHFGVMAQDVAKAFADEGLDANDYGIFCYDEWDEELEIQAYDEKTDKVVITRPYKAGGNRYGVRYDELFAFILGAM